MPALPQFSEAQYISNSVTSAIACILPIFALFYLCALATILRYAKQHPRPINKKFGFRIQRYGLAAYLLVFLTSVVELALSLWLRLQYHFHHNFPNSGTKAAVELLLFSSSWTMITAAIYSLLFLHPAWSRKPVASIGAQGLWVLLTWVFWMTGSGLLNHSLEDRSCDTIVYCEQIQTLFAFSVIQIVMLTLAMSMLLWLTWHCARTILI